LKIFPDHILFFNPGILPNTITIEQLLANQYVSTPRNRQIAKLVKEMGLIERYGTGIKRVRKMFVDYGLAEPVFEAMSGGLAVTVYGLKDLSKVGDRVGEKVIEKVGEKVIEKVGEKITQNQQLILDCIIENPYITTANLSSKVGISSRKIAVNLSKLKSKGLIERIGADKGGYWKVK